MKKFKYTKSIMLATLSLAALGSSCSGDLLNQSNENATSTANFGTSEEQVKSAVNGAFHPITGTFFWGRILHSGALLRSDEFNNFPLGSNTAMATFLGKPGDRWATEPWQELYKSIGRCNNIINNVNKEGIPNDVVRNNLVGQAYFLRAFDYWYLVNLYGNVPLVLDVPDLDNLYVKQAAKQAVWDQIVADLGKAETMLPAQWTGDDLGRPTSGAATALKGKSYLYQKKWALAHATLLPLVGKYTLLPAAQYGDNFTEKNENNSESVFELQFLGQQTFVWGSDIPGTGTMGNFHIDYAPPGKTPDKGHVVNPWLKNLFEANGDTYRRNQTLAYNYLGATGYGGTPYATDFVSDIAIATAAGVEPIFSKKYAGMDIGVRSQVDFLGTNVGTNWRVIRYSDVLLMLAEALNEDDKTALAGPYVTMVRQRPGSGLVDLLPTVKADKVLLRNAIIDERAMELAGEGHRFFDLVRWGLADKYMGATSAHGKNPKSLSGGIFKSNRDELIWIPSTEIDSNPNLKQNQGYN
ncbi:RagB/SusD family nutrient uptake outer membrane protein [Flavobacterium ovatum]|uniref:RagB/SusD family nutrient uptake outer membrane protein n=1 Tax=Flavobacterium ovatum TaxID=1928857 RepID=UPI00344D8FE2